MLTETIRTLLKKLHVLCHRTRWRRWSGLDLNTKRNIGLEAIARRLETIASRPEAIASRPEAIASRLEAITLRLEAIATRNKEEIKGIMIFSSVLLG